MTSLLNAASAAFPMLEQGFYIDLNWLGQFVRIIVEGVGVVGVGIIVFTLILKAITTPFDVYQRVKMRKQNLIMQQLQPELEKLQKQYANDKKMYQMKMMELQKKNGYSILGACLPMIISLVILIVAVTAFQTYSQYANLALYEKMAVAYNDAVKVYTVDGKDYHLAREGQEADDLTISLADFASPRTEQSERDGATEEITYTVYRDGEINRMRVESSRETAFLYYTYSLDADEVRREYYVDLDKSYTLNEGKTEITAKVKDGIAALMEGGQELPAAAVNYFKQFGSVASRDWFRANPPKFLWIKNVWYPDVSYKHPVQSYSDFKSSFSSGIYPSPAKGGRSIGEVISEEQYNSLTALLTEEKDEANGYFILIILTIGLMVLSQFLMMRSQKAMNQYQTVDGQGARTQKVMMIVMPLIYAITGFLWTAAFSIYIAVSSLIGIVVTLLSNLVIGHAFRKKEEEAIKNRYTRSAPWKETDGKKKKKDK